MRRTVPLAGVMRATVITGLVVVAVVSAGRASASPDSPVASKQRVAIEVKTPLDARTGTFVLDVPTPGPLKNDSGSITFTSGPTPVFTRRIVRGQRVDRFRGTNTLTGKQGTLVMSQQVDFVSAGNRYMVGAGNWSIVRGTGAYAGLKGGGRSALVSPPAPPGRFGFAQHEGFVTTR
jgi:hypothetical protein